MQELAQRIKKAMENSAWETEYKEQMGEMRKEIVDFHGEMVLLMNYSSMNYTGLAKILKKYDKRTGGVVRLPFIQKVVHQPFFTTDLISKLVKDCESTIESVFPPLEPTRRFRAAAAGGGEGMIFRNTVAALLTMQDIRRGSSTYSHFSLPPLNIPDFDLLHSLQPLSPIQIP